MSIFLFLAVSLLLTLALELGFALLWGVERRDLTLVALVNVLLASPAEILISTVEPLLPVVLIIAVLVITALLVRRFTKKK